MWIGIAIGAAVIVVLAVAVWAWRRSPRLAEDMRQWQTGLDVLGRTANSAPLGGPPPAPAEREEVDTVHVLGPAKRDR